MAKLIGYAAVFNSLSEDLGFRESIRPGAFDGPLRERQDVLALVDHDSRQLLARTKAGSLNLKADAKGLRAEIEIPDTSVGRDTATLVELGTLAAMSFAFATEEDDFKVVNGELFREVIKIRRLLDVSIVARPAYPATSVSARYAGAHTGEMVPLISDEDERLRMGM